MITCKAHEGSCYQTIQLNEDAGTIIVYGRSWSKTLYYTYIILCFMTLGLLSLLGYWIPKIYVYLVTVPIDSITRCTHLFINHHHPDKDRTEWKFVKIITCKDAIVKFSNFNVDCNDQDMDIQESRIHEHSNEGYVRYFFYQGHRFVYYPPKRKFFCSSHWSVGNITYKDSPEIANRHRTELAAVFGINDIRLSHQSIESIFLHEILQPYYVFLYVSVFVWFYEEYYYYAGVVFTLATITIIIQVNETRKNIANVREMVKQIYCPVKIWISNQWISRSSKDLIVNDLFQIDMDYCPCDAIMESGECLVDESILTGESIPISKRADSSPIDISTEYKDTLSHLKLFSGTRILHVRCHENIQYQVDSPIARVTGIGFNTTKGTLIRHILYPRPSKYRLYKETKYILIILTIIAMIGVILAAVRLAWIGMNCQSIILRLFDLFTTLVPPSLPVAITYGTIVAITRLRKKDIYCTESPKINVSGGLDLFCFDKTGTLTESNLELKGFQKMTKIQLFNDHPHQIVVAQFDAFTTKDIHTQTLELDNPCNRILRLGMASCHSLKMLNGELVGDPLDKCMFRYVGWTLNESEANNSISIINPQHLSNDMNSKYIILKIFDFFSILKRMSVIVKDFQGNTFAFVKGAPETIKNICNPSSIPHDYDNILQFHFMHGYHVISMGFKMLSSSINHQREDIEQDLIFVGLLVFENRLKSDTLKSLMTLKDGGIRIMMCTGDNLLTAINVSKECGIISSDSKIYIPSFIIDEQTNCQIAWKSISNCDEKLFHSIDLIKNQCLAIDIEGDGYELGCDGDSLNFIIKHYPREYLSMILKHCNVFGRMTPNQKRILVESLKEENYTVGYCGDGANDCSALRTADVGLALSQSEASVAAPFTCKTNSIKCSVDLILEGRSALCTSFSGFKFIVLLAFIDFSAVSIMYIYGSNMAMWQYIYIDLILRFPLAMCIGHSEPSNILASIHPPTSLYYPQAAFSLFSQIIIQLSFQYIGYVIISNKPWYVKPLMRIHGADNPIPSHLNASIFLLSIFQYLIVAILFCSNEPHQLSIFKNRPLILYTMLLLILNTYLLLFPHKIIMDFIELAYLDINYRIFILGFALVDCITSYFVHVYAWELYENLFILFSKLKKKSSNSHSAL